MKLNLSDEVKDINNYDIIIFLQKYKFDSNNLKIDEIINERDEFKRNINKKFKDWWCNWFQFLTVQIFSIFHNNQYFCIKENKAIECFICNIKKLEEIKDLQPFIFINNTNIWKKVYLIYCYQNTKKIILLNVPDGRGRGATLLTEEMKIIKSNIKIWLNKNKITIINIITFNNNIII